VILLVAMLIFALRSRRLRNVMAVDPPPSEPTTP
jgi:hypothetical protein